jgi:hypothetical protein
VAAYLSRAEELVARQAWEEAEAEIRRSLKANLLIFLQSETKKIHWRSDLGLVTFPTK